MPSPFHDTTILVVDDSPELITLLRRALSEQGYSVLALMNGFEVIEELRQRASTRPRSCSPAEAKSPIASLASRRARMTTSSSLSTRTNEESTNIVDVYVNYLRRKLDAEDEPMLRTVRGVGYMLHATSVAVADDQ